MADLISDPQHNATGPAPTPDAGEHAGAKRRARPIRHICSVCGHELPVREVVRLDVVRPAMIERIRQEKPDLPADGFICRADLDRFRSSYVSQLLTRERGELTRLEHEVVKSLADHETLAENTEAEYAERRTLGERMSDRLASFGGSWTFISLFGVVLLAWMGFNIVVAGRSHFDPYRVILLTLALACT